MSFTAKNLIKGRIAETIFAQMFREARHFTVLPFGYENLTPELAQYLPKTNSSAQKALESIRTAPDFALISHSREAVYLVEVKYQANFSEKHTLGHAERMHKAWNPSFLFIASGDGFRFSPVSEIIKNNGEVKRLDESWVSSELQKKFLALLNEFEK